MAEPILVVHGTFANPAEEGPSKTRWWQRDGSFCQALDDELKLLDCPARCWDGVEEVFKWDGNNSEVSRRIAADDLAVALLSLEANETISKYHLVCHSHGGNAAVRAIRHMSAFPAKLSTATFLGTPFFRFRSDSGWQQYAQRVNWPVLLTGMGWLGYVSFLKEKPEPNEFWGALLVIVALLVFYFARYKVWDFPDSRVGTHVFSFQADEAFLLLNKCIRLRENPSSFLKAHLDLEIIPNLREWRSPTWRSGWKAAAAVLKYSEYFLNKANSWTSTSPTPTALSTSVNIPSTLRDAGKFLLSSAFPISILAIAFGVIALAMAITTFVALTIQSLLAILWSWFFQLLANLVLRQGIIAAASLGLGQDVGRITGVARSLGAGTSVQKISAQLEEDMRQRASDTSRNAGGALFDTIGGDGPVSIVAALKQVYGDESVAHCQYYQQAEIIGRIAELISGANRSGQLGLSKGLLDPIVNLPTS